jgi:hypothetical protein
MTSETFRNTEEQKDKKRVALSIAAVNPDKSSWPKAFESGPTDLGAIDQNKSSFPSGWR